MRIIICVNAAWNIWNFRKPLVEALVADGHEVIILAPTDDTVPQLKRIGCMFIDLKMNVKGLNPLVDIKFIFRLRRIFRDLKPDIILAFTIKNNTFGGLAAKSLGIPLVPNVTGLGTAFLSSRVLERIPTQASWMQATSSAP